LKRKQVKIRNWHHRALKIESFKSNKSQAEIVREALDEYLESPKIRINSSNVASMDKKLYEDFENWNDFEMDLDVEDKGDFVLIDNFSERFLEVVKRFAEEEGLLISIE